ncbi:MAG: phosphatidylglycerophosphatase A [Elusimicrobia bacterium]|nr:phosphatidylglycerophosphatase A [Elusimicrobiota bacterium]
MKIWSKFAELFATDFYLGFLPAKITGRSRGSGGGTLGTLLGLLLIPLLPEGRTAYAVFLLAAAAFAVLVSHKFCADSGVEDDQRVIIDETIGYWAAIAWLPRGFFTLVCAFALFRAFDGLKPWPIRQADESVGGGFGVVLDDVLAGIAANLVMRGLMLFLPLRWIS